MKITFAQTPEGAVGDWVGEWVVIGFGVYETYLDRANASGRGDLTRVQIWDALENGTATAVARDDLAK